MVSSLCLPHVTCTFLERRFNSQSSCKLERDCMAMYCHAVATFPFAPGSIIRTYLQCFVLNDGNLGCPHALPTNQSNGEAATGNLPGKPLAVVCGSASLAAQTAVSGTPGIVLAVRCGRHDRQQITWGPRALKSPIRRQVTTGCRSTSASQQSRHVYRSP